jgi:hypothetical protein
MASSSPKHRWHGSRELLLQPGYPRIVENASGSATELRYHGPFKSAQARKPKYGVKVEGYAGFVDQTEVYPDDTGQEGGGFLKIVIKDESGSNETLSTDDGTQPVFEVEWIDLNPSILTHPRYSPGGVDALTEDDLVDIEKWRNEDKASLRKKGQYTGENGAPVPLSANAKKVAWKILRGQETYVCPAPVARLTNNEWTTPKTTEMGKRRSTAPIPNAPGGYQWLSTADKSTRTGANGKWQRVREWTGAKIIDTDLYAT